jgi:hypothetical protein
MSFIDSENREKLISDASIDSFEKVLRNLDYKVVRTKYSVTGTKGGFWSTNGKIDTITIRDTGSYRECEGVYTAKGYMCRPHSNILAEIVAEAEKDIDNSEGDI